MYSARFYVWSHIILIVLVLIGAINWGIIGLGYQSLVSGSYAKYVYILIGLAGLILAFKRETYLPFLGWTAVPSQAFQIAQPKESNVKLTVPVPYKDAIQVVYWAANPSESNFSNPIDAYKSTQNVGIISITGPTVELSFLCPAAYSVFYGTLHKHVHYRFVLPNGMMSKIFSKKVSC